MHTTYSKKNIRFKKKPRNARASYDFARNRRLLTAKDYKQTFDAVSFKVHQPNLMCLVHVKSADLKNIDINDADSVKNMQEAQNAQSIEHISRLGLAISKAKNKRANERNRIKRLVREYFRLHQHEFSQPVDMVFLTKTATHEVSNREIHTQLANIWRKIQYKLSQPHGHKGLQSSQKKKSVANTKINKQNIANSSVKKAKEK